MKLVLQPFRSHVLILSYLAPLLVPYADLVDVLSLMLVVKTASAYVMLLSIVKLAWKFSNNLTHIRITHPTSATTCHQKVVRTSRMHTTKRTQSEKENFPPRGEQRLDAVGNIVVKY
jgi:hypothetical protein